MNTELYIESNRLDITNEISALLNFAVDDIKDFSARSTTWSRTIVLPGTSNNNKLFGHIFQVGQANNYDPTSANVGYNFNASKSAACLLFQDQIQTFKGVLRLLQININNGFQGACEYEVSIFGNMVGLNVALTGKLLEDLDFSAYDHTYNDANIVASWDNPGGSGYYYPLIDCGTYSTGKHDWDIRTFRPALYVKEYLDKMFAAAQFRYVSPLFNTARFQSLVVPYNRKLLTSFGNAATGDGVANTNPVFGNDGLSDIIDANVIFTTFTSSIFTESPPASGAYQYTGTIAATFRLRGTVTGTAFDVGTLYINNSDNTISGLGPETISIGYGATVPWTYNFDKTITLTPGQYFFLNFKANPDEITPDFVASFLTATVIITPQTGVGVEIAPGGQVVANDIIPKNIRQIDFLIAIVKMWNLYVYEDKFDESLIYITPYIDFYSHNTSNANDWTHKLNRDKVVKVKPMSELNSKIYKFKFKSDSDYYNDLYRKRYNEGYGDRVYDSEFEFTEQEKSFEVVFSATPLVGYAGEDKIYPTIFKRSGSDASPTEETVDSNIRILLTKKITGVVPWDIKNAATVLNTLTRYGYAGHLDDPDIPANDLNFGAPRELFFVLSAGSISANQFNEYWAAYMREITDKDSKLVIGNFYLTAKDILNLDFSKYVYVDGVAFRLNAIKDYDATTPNDCVVELFKVNLASNSELATPDGPPDGCYLLWSDEQTMDWDTADALLYSGCEGDPGDGGPPPPDTFYLTWEFKKTIIGFGSISIKLNGALNGFATANDTSTFIVTAGDSIEVSVSGSSGKHKRVFVSNDVDGTIHDTTVTTVTNVYTFTIDANKNYSVVGELNS